MRLNDDKSIWVDHLLTLFQSKIIKSLVNSKIFFYYYNFYTITLYFTYLLSSVRKSLNSE